MSPRDLSAYDIHEGKVIELEFEGGIKVKGEIITGTRNLQGKIILITFKDCTVSHGETILFKPEWGIYNMAVGKEVVSAFSGPADINSFDLTTHVPSTKTIQANKSEERLELEDKHPNDWLLPVELYELAFKGNEKALCETILSHLESVKQNNPKLGRLIDDGLEITQKSLVA